jgi:hypothetical protein
VTTYGIGARGFNVYDASLASARFQSISTHADGAISVKVSKDVPVLEITDGVTTLGGPGTSLVRGVQAQLSAIAVSIQPGGRIGRLTAGRWAPCGDGIVTLDVEGSLDFIAARQGIAALGAGSCAVRVACEVPGLDTVLVTAPHGQPVVYRTEQGG